MLGHAPEASAYAIFTGSFKMKNKTLCLYWPQFDKVLNVRMLENGNTEFEIKTNKTEHIEINATQMRSFRAWLEDNNI